jgi:hypothetical protein
MPCRWTKKNPGGNTRRDDVLRTQAAPVGFVPVEASLPAGEGGVSVDINPDGQAAFASRLAPAGV